jgi:hypothetical protein
LTASEYSTQIGINETDDIGEMDITIQVDFLDTLGGAATIQTGITDILSYADSLHCPRTEQDESEGDTMELL